MQHTLIAGGKRQPHGGRNVFFDRDVDNNPKQARQGKRKELQPKILQDQVLQERNHLAMVVLVVVAAAVAGAVMLALAWQVYRERNPDDRASKHLFAFSILYLFLLYAVLLIERGWDGLLVRWAV